jgi:hypothetical protein
MVPETPIPLILRISVFDKEGIISIDRLRWDIEDNYTIEKRLK